MTKSTKFINALLRVVETHDNNEIKSFVGDSLDNNRVVTVNQLLRFLSSSDKSNYRKLAKNLRVVYGELRFFMRVCRLNRSDAYDVNELLTAYSFKYHFNTKFNKSLGQLLK